MATQNPRGRATRWAAAAAIPAVLAALLTLTGCNTDVCQHHGGLNHAVDMGGTWYYHCNDGAVV